MRAMNSKRFLSFARNDKASGYCILNFRSAAGTAVRSGCRSYSRLMAGQTEQASGRCNNRAVLCAVSLAKTFESPAHSVMSSRAETSLAIIPG